MARVQDWNEMVVFVKVVETGGFQRAAEALGLPKSSVSRKVASLEQRLGARLLHRTTRTVKTTEIGQGYYDRCAPLVADAEAAELAVTECQSEPVGTLRISVPNTGLGPFMRTIFDYAVRYPRVRLDVVTTDRYVDLVRERIDVAIRAGDLADSNLIARKLTEARLRFAASPKYLDERGRPETIDDLREHDGIALSPPDSQPTWHLEDGTTIPVRGRVRLTSMGNAIDAAVSGLGIVFAPEALLAPELDAGTLERVLPHLGNSSSVAVVYPSRDNLSTNVRAFVDHLVENLAPLTSAMVNPGT